MADIKIYESIIINDLNKYEDLKKIILPDFNSMQLYAIAVFDKDTKFLLFNNTYNEGYFRKFGFYPEIGKKLEDYKNRANEYNFWRNCYDRVLNGEKYSITHEYKDNSQLYYVNVYFFPINNSLNEIIGFYIIVFDENKYDKVKISHKNYLIY